MSLKERYRISKSVGQNIPLSEVDGGFPWLALAPFAAAAGMPIAKEVGEWVGRKITGKGIHQAGMVPVGQGILRSGDMLAPQNRPLHLNPLIGSTKGGSILPGLDMLRAMTGLGGVNLKNRTRGKKKRSKKQN